MKRHTARAKKSTTKKTTKRTQHHSVHHHVLIPVTFRRIIIITTAITLFLVAFALFNKPKITQSVAGLSIAQGLFAQATVNLPDVTEAVSYNLYYKKVSAGEYSNAAWEIPSDYDSYTISYLKKGEEYHYKIAAVDASGAEFWWSEEKPLTNLKPM